MPGTLTEPTPEELVVTEQLRELCKQVLRRGPEVRDAVAAHLSIPKSEVDRLMRRDDWTLPGALRVARAAGLTVGLQLQVS